MSVLAPQVVRALAPAVLAAPDGVLVDATVGLGGHAHALLSVAAPRMAVMIDRDARALALARQRLADAPCPVHFVHAPFSTIADVLAELGVDTVSAIVADLGVSSLQLDSTERGFSFRGDAPLDMRMDPSRGRTAAELLADIEPRALATVLAELGEEPDARRIAEAIVGARPTTTLALADVVAGAMTGRQRRKLGTRIHPATRTFMALRIHVNDELGELDRFLAQAPSLLMLGGRLAVISFHSLEDRRVKRCFRELTTPPRVPPHVPMTERERPRPRFVLVPEFARGVTPSPAELTHNPRARSARVRVLQRAQA